MITHPYQIQSLRMLIEYFHSSIALHVAVLNFAETTLNVQWLHKLHFHVPPDNKIRER
jgi:hypothetical protein